MGSPGRHESSFTDDTRSLFHARYRTIVADPPWDHSDGTGVTLTVGMSTRPHPNPHATGLPYPTMTVEMIEALPVSELVEKDAHLYLWTTNRFLRFSFGVAEKWGFTPICVLTWCKERRGFLGGGTFPSDTEFILFCRRGNLRANDRAPGRWYRWPRKFGAPTGEGGRRSGGHSAKPEAFLDLVEQLSPGPYLELFARRNRLGWDTWGNEALDHIGTDARVAEGSGLLSRSGLAPVEGSNPSPSVFNPPYRFEVSQHGPATIYDSVNVGWVARVKESLPHKALLAETIAEGLNEASGV